MTVPTEPDRGVNAATLAELNDLLALDHDAVEAYTIAIAALTNVGRRETVMRFRADHERHITRLTQIVRALGGTPVERGHVTSGPFKAAMQALGSLAGGDGAVILAFKTNEAQVCEKYTRAATHAAEWTDEIAEAVTEGADDEARHYDWAVDQLATLGVAPESATARAARAAETVQARFADGAEALERGGRRGLDAVRRGASRVRERLPERPSNRVLAVGAIAAGVSFILTAALGASLRRRR
jgi:bacterioferritin (cytochrome b1)